jgi:hypothetical protein
MGKLLEVWKNLEFDFLCQIPEIELVENRFEALKLTIHGHESL